MRGKEREKGREKQREGGGREVLGSNIVPIWLVTVRNVPSV